MNAYRILPYTADATATAAQWLAYVDACAEGLEGPDAEDARREAIDKVQRRGVIPPDAAALLSEILALA